MLRKTVKIGDMDVAFQSSAAIPRLYRAKFKRDIFKDLTRLENSYKGRKDLTQLENSYKDRKDLTQLENSYKDRTDLTRLENSYKDQKDLTRLENSYKDRTDGVSELEIEDLEVFENVAYIMALHADPTIPPTIEDWLDQFEMFSIYEVLPEILELWGSNLFTDSQAKKNIGQRSGS